MFDLIQTRRENLRQLIESKYDGKQSKFIDATGINQGELSKLLKDKSFGEKKARSIETATGLPAGWLDKPIDSPEQLDNIVKLDNGYAPPEGYIRFAVMDAPANLGQGIESSGDYVEIVNFVAVAEAWAKRNLGGSLNKIQVITGIGDSMKGTIESGEILFVDTAVNYYDGEGIYVIHTPNGRRAKRLQMLQNGSLKIISDNKQYESETISGAELEQLHIFGKLRGSWGFKRFE